MFFFQGFQLLAHIRLEFSGTLDEFEPLHLFDGRDRRSQRDGMRFIRVPVREVVILEVVGNLLRGRAEAERHVCRSDSLRGDENVGLHAPVIDGKPFAGAAPPSHHFIVDHQHALAIADFAQARKVFGRWNQNAVGANDRLENDRCDIAFVLDHVLDVVNARDITARIGVFDGTVVAVCLRSEDDIVILPAGSIAQRRGSPVAAIEPAVDP